MNVTLVVGKECGGGCELAKYLRDEAVEPKGLLAAMHHHDILALSGGQGDNLLLL
jgi:hypothetical protein